MGRPRKREEEKMKRRITIRIDNDTYSQLQKKIINKGHGELSKFLRTAIKKQLHRV